MKAEKKKPQTGGKSKGLQPRTASRMAAVQALYQMDIAGTDLNEVIHDFVAVRFPAVEEGETLSGADPVYFAEILRGVVRRQRDIDPMIDDQLAIGWRLVRVDSILRAILRGGVYELIERRDVPARVAINEYINVAHAFFDEEEPKVVNGVLDKLARALRPTEFEPETRA
jgi:N utilization substance protein B